MARLTARSSALSDDDDDEAAAAAACSGEADGHVNVRAFSDGPTSYFFCEIRYDIFVAFRKFLEIGHNVTVSSKSFCYVLLGCTMKYFTLKYLKLTWKF